jgi:hypothetical protein
MRIQSSALVFAACLLLPATARSQEVPRPVIITNLPDIQPVSGKVTVSEPVPSGRLRSDHAVVSPGTPQEVGSLTEGALIDVTGFTSVVLSLAGEVKGTVAREGRVGALLVPDEPELIRALREDGVVPFPLKVEARVLPTQQALFTSDQPALPVGFPRYRVFFYNTTPRATEVSLWVYMTTR